LIIKQFLRIVILFLSQKKTALKLIKGKIISTLSQASSNNVRYYSK
jgi:hypothetical protein